MFRLKSILAIAISVAFTVWFLGRTNILALPSQLAPLLPWVWVAPAVGMFVSYCLRAFRVSHEFKHVPSATFGSMLKVTLVHNMMVNFLPFRSGEITFPWLLNRATGITTMRATATLLWFRVQDACVVVGIGIWIIPELSFVLRLLASAGLLAMPIVIRRWANGQTSPVSLEAKPSVLTRLKSSLSQASEFSVVRWVTTVSNWLIKLSVQVTLLVSLLPIAWNAGLAGALGAEFAAFLPIQGVAGFGTFEAGSASAMLPFGVEWLVGLQTAALMHIFILLSSLVFGVLSLGLSRSTFKLSLQEKS